MSRIWSSEASAIFTAMFILVMLGIFTGNWLAASLITLGLYILWLYRRLAKLEKWIRGGTKTSQVYDDDGFVGIIIRHLYQQKKTHIQRKKSIKAIVGNLNRNISALPDATLLLNQQLEIEWCNEPARYLLNIRSPQDLGHRIANLIRQPDFLDYLQDFDSRDHIEIIAPGDQNLTVEIKLISIGGGQALLIARNISDQKLLQESLKHFVANASHELKSPLTVISGHLEMLESEPRLSESALASLQTAQRQTARMKELIQNLLLLSQVESYQLRPGEGERVSVLEVMANSMATLDKYADKDRVSCDFPADYYLLGVQAEIEGICINLIENALKYSIPRTPIKASWSSNVLNEYIFTVSDQGPGLGPVDLTRITERYYRVARSSSEVSGSGLGLAIVQQAAHKHGAILEINSSEGQSSSFSVTFPSYRCLQESLPDARIFNISDY